MINSYTVGKFQQRLGNIFIANSCWTTLKNDIVYPTGRQVGTNPLPDTGGYWNDPDSSTTVDVFGGIAFKISVDFYVLLPIQSVAAFFIINYVTLILTFVINRIFSLVKTFANSSQESQQSLMMLMPTGRYMVERLPLFQVFQDCLCVCVLNPSSVWFIAGDYAKAQQG